MEGLIPLVFKAVQKTKTRRRYHCLSSGAALSYDISDFYKPPLPPPPPHHHPLQEMNDCDISNGELGYAQHHRRHKSLGDCYSSSSPSTAAAVIYTDLGGPPLPLSHPSSAQNNKQRQQLVRFRSHNCFRA
ncbi:uncharacterized protein LOC131150392 [Malania oleifera]|uniref:uncharacterized protein LOC131150392 n=1 Tax=Malania oleifera TaxID=397392 RepID=UPI0025ADAD53|nr:uncharacterized protein LOC131150392 [Malania oleifera]